MPTIRTPAELQAVMRTDYPLSEQQWAAVDAPLSPAVVVAGAGSGKTTLMAARVVHLVATGQVRADQVLGLTFTTKAAAELRTRVRETLDAAGYGRGVLDGEEEVLEPTVATYNSYASSLLTEHGLLIGHEPDTRLLADATRYQLAARAITRHTGAVRLLSDSPKHVIDYLLALEGAMSEHLVDVAAVRAFDADTAARLTAALASSRAKKDIEDALQVTARREELLGLVGTYRRLKAELGLMDFSDQIALAARLAVERPEVGATQRDTFRIVLLDEYQDTSVAQAQMLSALFSGATATTGRGHAVTAVGDPNQAIYGWRGASVSNILGFGADFPAADGSTDVPTYPLTVNRRSDARILDVANHLAEDLYAAFPKVQPLQAKPGADDGAVRVVVHPTYPEELTWLAVQVRAAHPHTTDGLWREIGVLTRDNQHAADVFDALSRAGVPVEIVGLKGLLALPEVAEVVATLSLLHDLTANADLLTLLSGPRWAVGARDLALLGRRAGQLAGGQGRSRDAMPLDVELDLAVAGADPTEVAALSDALSDPGDLGYSAIGRERFAQLAEELRRLRRHAGEPLLDLVRRIIDTCGIDVELASSVSPTAAARRDNLDLFVKGVAEFQAVDGDVTLPALLAYLNAEDEFGNGLDVATPTLADSVKLLTVHRAKGLEWDVVFVVGVSEERFPHKTARPIWTRAPAVLPSPLRGDVRDLPVLRGHTKADLEQLRDDSRAHDLVEELRLAYVAFTRARHQLWVSSYLWKPDRKTPLGPSSYQRKIRETLQGWGLDADSWSEKPDGEPNPLTGDAAAVPWPVTEQTAEALRRLDGAERVRAATAGEDAAPEPDLVDASLIAQWDDELVRLAAEAEAERAPVVEVPLPPSLSATSVARLRDDPESFARDLARPMPRQPSPAARFGTRFHAWV